MIASARRRSGGAAPFDPATLFTSGEVGDLWRFDNVHTDQTVVGSNISAATGLVNGHVLGVADPANLPDLAQPSGIYAARFDGSADRLIYNFGTNIAQPGTIIICVNDGSIATHSLVSGSSSTLRWQLGTSSANFVILFAGSTYTTTLAENYGFKVLTAEFNGTSSKLYANGTQIGTTGNAGTQATNQITVGANFDGSGGFNGDIYSVLIISRLLTSTERDRAERLLGSHAGLTW
jgi:hypothetical protein